MSWTRITDGRGQRWAVNLDGIHLALRASVRAEQIRKRSKIVTLQNGLLMPKTYVYETDWSGFHAAVDSETANFYREAQWRVAKDAHYLRYNLLGMLASARSDYAEIERMRKKASIDSAQSIQSNAAILDGGLAVLKFVRDFSTSIIVVGSGFLSGGAALGFLGVGSALRGTATYQDTGNVGSAFLSTTGTFIVGAMGIGASASNLSRSDKLILLGVGASGSGTTAGLQSLVEGQTADVALKKALASAGLHVVGHQVGLKVEKMSVPVNIKVGGLVEYSSNKLADQIGSKSATEAKPGSAIAAPRVSGNISFGEIPVDPGSDSDYVRTKCMRLI